MAPRLAPKCPELADRGIAKQKCQLTFSELVLYRNWFVGPAVSPSLRKHALVSAQGPSSDCQFPAQVFVVKNA